MDLSANFLGSTALCTNTHPFNMVIRWHDQNHVRTVTKSPWWWQLRLYTIVPINHHLINPTVSQLYIWNYTTTFLGQIPPSEFHFFITICVFQLLSDNIPWYPHYWLVVWNMNFIFPFSWEFHHPNWQTPSFFREVGSTTNQSLYCRSLSFIIHPYQAF